MTKTDDDVNEQYSEKVLSTGAWIDSEFLERVLGTSLEDEIKVVDYEVTAAVGAGDNYLSILYKTSVKYTSSESDEQQQRHLMIKGEPTAKILLDMIEDMGVFRKEIAMYGQCLPAMYRAFKEYYPCDTPFVAPDSYKCARENTLVMEDLGQSGYKMANRRNQLDFDHCAATLRTLARFHALSVKVFEQDPELISSVAGEMYSEANREKMAQFLDAVFPVLAGVVDNWGEKARFASFLREFGQSLWEKLIYTVRPSEGFNVLNHGDMWVNNIMYKLTDDGAVENAKLVDFQLARYSTPALDLHYFFFTSPQAAVLSGHMFELVEIYHEALTSDLATIGVEVDYPLEQLHEDMRDRAAFGVVALAQILPIIVAPPSELFDMDNYDPEHVSIEEHPMMTNYKNSYYQATAGSFLEHLESIGYLDEAIARTRPIVEAAEARKAAEADEQAAADDDDDGNDE